MKILKQLFSAGFLLAMISVSNDVQGQKRNNNSTRDTKNERMVSNDRVNSNHYRYDRRYRTQPVRRNPQYRYPKYHRVIRTLPINHVRIVFRGIPYFYYSGIYYATYGEEYIVVLPPRGFRVSVLPVGYVRIVIGPSVYFYYSGVYYIESSSDSEEVEGKYKVVNPPVGTVVSEIHEDSKEVEIDGKIYYEYNEILYKKNIDSNENITYEVVYS